MEPTTHYTPPSLGNGDLGIRDKSSEDNNLEVRERDWLRNCDEWTWDSFHQSAIETTSTLSLATPPLSPQPTSQETSVNPPPTAMVMRNRVTAPGARILRKPPAATTAHVANQKVALIIDALAVGTAVIFEGPNGGFCSKRYGEELRGSPG